MKHRRGIDLIRDGADVGYTVGEGSRRGGSEPPEAPYRIEVWSDPPEAGGELLETISRSTTFGVSIAAMFASVATVAVNSVPLRQAAMAGATNTVLRQTGGALGPAVIGSIYSTRLADGAAAADAFSSALLVTTVLLVAAGVLVLVAGNRRAAT